MEIEKRIKFLEKELLINNLFLIFILGCLLNMGVMMANDLKMPAYFPKGDFIPPFDNSVYIPFTNFNDIKYPYLSDVFKIKISSYTLRFSIGDILMFWSIILILIISTKYLFIYLNERRLKNGIYRING